MKYISPLKEIHKEFSILGKIGLSILIIGLINIYNIVKYGIIFSLPIPQPKIYPSLGEYVVDYTEVEGIIKIDINNIKFIILISSLIYIIFSAQYKSLPLFYPSKMVYLSSKMRDKRYSIEYQLLIGLGLIGLIWILISKDIISLYLGLELYSFSYYILILVKESLAIRKIAILYLILSSLASSLLLYSFYLIYFNYGTLNIETLSYIFTSLDYQGGIVDPYSKFIIYFITSALIFKLGLIPFSYWLIRLYADLDKRILWYQLTIPKLIFFILLFNFIKLFPFDSIFVYFFFILSILSITFGSIGGLFQNKDNLLLSYSSILNIGFIFLSLSLILFSLSENPSVLWFSEVDENIWIIIQYFFIYFLTIIGLFSALFLFHYSSIVFNFKSFFSYPFFFLSFFILIFSFIGLPPFSGFFAKFFLFFTLLSNSYLITSISISSLIIFTLLSSFLYFKFLFSSTTLKNSSLPSYLDNSQFSSEKFDSKKIITGSLLLAFTSLLTITYSFFISFLTPFFYLF